MNNLWVEVAALMFTILASAVGSVTVLYNRMAKDKKSIDDELLALRMSAYEEYKTLRKELGDATSIARVEFGETVHAIREKVTEVELWTRDQLANTRHNMMGGVDQRFLTITDMVDKVEERMRQLELHSARQGSHPRQPREPQP